MPRTLLRWAIGLASLLLVLIAWLIFGRQFVLLLDRITTREIESRPVTEMRYEGTGANGLIQIADITLDTYSTNGTQLNIAPDGQNRLVISEPGKSFLFGPILEKKAGFMLAAIPDPGDQVRISLQRSHFAWPTPFDFNFVSGRSPSWKRNRYYHLSCAKQSGARLELLWRFEQYRYERWMDSDMTRADSTGLIRAVIEP